MVNVTWNQNFMITRFSVNVELFTSVWWCYLRGGWELCDVMWCCGVMMLSSLHRVMMLSVWWLRVMWCYVMLRCDDVELITSVWWLQRVMRRDAIITVRVLIAFILQNHSQRDASLIPLVLFVFNVRDFNCGFRKLRLKVLHGGRLVPNFPCSFQNFFLTLNGIVSLR